MESKKNIGNFFKENLEQLDRSPSSFVWENIEKDLDKKKKKRRFIIWFFFVAFICGSTATYTLVDYHQINQRNSNNENVLTTDFNSKINKNSLGLTNSVNNENQTISNKEKKNLGLISSGKNDNQTLVNKNKKTTTKGNTLVTENSISKNSKKTTNITYNYSKIDTSKKRKSKVKLIQSYAHKINKRTKSKLLSQKKSETNLLTSNDSLPKNNSNINLVSNLNSSDDSLITKNKSKGDSIFKKNIKITEKKKIIPTKEKDSTSDVVEKEKDKQLIIAPYYGYVFLGNFGKGNTLSKDYNILKEGSSITSTYGVLVRWMGTEKIGIQTGIGLINSNHFTKISKNESNFIDAKVIDLNTSAETINSIFTNSSQVIFTEENSFIEVPFEAYYIISNKKFGFATSFGISIFILNKNEIYLESDSVTKFKIGSSKNVAEQSFTANAKLNLFYKLSKRVQFDLYPEFQYQIMSYKDTPNYFPYYLSLKAGICYKF